MKRFITALVTLLICASNVYADTTHRVLMVVSGYGQDEGKTLPGFEMQEFATAYWVFADHGLTIHVASPQGGSVVADRYDAAHPAVARLMADPVASDSIEQTRALTELTDDYHAVFVVGGKGAMFDLPGNPALQQRITTVYESGGIVSAVCHGPAALTDVTLSDNSYLVAGRRVNSFSNQEEHLFSRRWIDHFDFLLEDRLVERGASFSAGPMMLSYVVEDERLVTGQNPASTAAVAEAVVRQLGLAVKPRQLDQQERTLALIGQLLKGSQPAKEKLASDSSTYNRQLIAAYLYYYLQGTDDASEIRTALDLANLVADDLARPQMQLQIAKGHLTLKQLQDAARVLEQLVAAHPGFEPGIKLLAEITSEQHGVNTDI